MGFFNQRRVCTKDQYTGVFSSRKKIRSNSFILHWCSNPCGFARVGVSVAKKNIAKAVSRNKYKRLVKENFRLITDKLPSVDIVIVVKKEAQLLSNQDFVSELKIKWDQLAKSGEV
jgi:ribonuclease P protein component